MNNPIKTLTKKTGLNDNKFKLVFFIYKNLLFKNKTAIIHQK